MAGERQIYWGPTIADAKYRTRDDDPQGGQFVVVEDTDNGTVLLRWDNVAGEWVYGGPVNMGGEDLTNAGTLSAASVTVTNAVSAASASITNAVTATDATLSGLLTMDDAAADPTANGQVQRNGADLKAYSGGEVRNLSNIGSGSGGALTDAGTDNADGGDQYVLPQAADSVDLQDSGEVENAENVDTATADIAQTTCILRQNSGSGGQTIPDDTDTVVEFDATSQEHTDVLSADLANDRIQVQRDGMYYISPHVLWNINAGGWSTGDGIYLKIRLNGSILEIDYKYKIGDASHRQSFSLVRTLSSGDTVSASVEQFSGVDQTIADGRYERRLEIFRIG